MKYHVTQKVLFRHCDPAGIVFYPRYLEMVNDSVESFFAELGYPFHEMHKTNGVPTVKLDASFVQASRHGDLLEFAIASTRVGGASLELAVTCDCAGERRFDANVTLVHVKNDMKSERWSDAIRAKLTSYLNSELKEASHG
jgi:4-hydroxybenzoyl-CoA thioesterase